jgi:glycosyltransferase involved in cell wall biosynthesis
VSSLHLAVVLPGLPVVGDHVEISDKTWSGLEAFRMRWPGHFSVIARPITHDISGNLGRQSYAVSDLPWQVDLLEPTEAVAALRPDVVQVPLHLSERPLLAMAPCVVAAENSARERLRYAASGTPRHHLPRMAVGAVRQAWALREMVREAAGLACNGWAAWAAYRTTGRDPLAAPLLYFDTRLKTERVEQAGRRLTLEGPRQDKARLAFSGRVHPSKGAHHAIAASAELDRRGVPHSLTMLGQGPERNRLQAESGPSVIWAGELEFEPAWIDFVSMSVDLMVLPHTQGDPSGTYLESAGLGVPVVGFDNAALRGHAQHAGFAATTERWSAAALASLIQEVVEDDDRRGRLAAAGVDFMRRHAVEPTFDARVEQLLVVAGAAR